MKEFPHLNFNKSHKYNLYWIYFKSWEMCLKRGTISYFPELVSFTCFHYFRVKYECFGVKWVWELYFSEFTVILREKGLKKWENLVFFLNFSKMWFLVLSISNMKYIQSITYKLVGESKKNHKKYSKCIFFIWFSSEICLKKGYFFGKMAGSRSFPGKFELYRSKYSKQTTLIISSYGETQANSYFSRNRHPKSAPQYRLK